MSDERLDELLRRLDVPATPDPAFVASSHAIVASAERRARRRDRTLFARLSSVLAPTSVYLGADDRPIRPSGRLVTAGLNGVALFVVAVLAVGLVALRANQSGATAPTATASSLDLLARVRSAGAIRIAVRPDFPQARAGALGGFDIDVATELGMRLGYRVDLVPVAAMEMSSQMTRWDIALPSSALVAHVPEFVSTRPYYLFPVFALVRQTSTEAAPSDLRGARICAVSGSSGEAWLEGSYTPESATAPVERPADPMIVAATSDQECLRELAAGHVDAAVSSTLSPTDLAARPSLRTLDGPVLTEARAIVAARNGPDPTDLLSEIDRVLGEMRRDGTLADLSRNRFGGEELTNP